MKEGGTMLSYERNGIEIGVYQIPDRKKPVLGIKKNSENILYAVASFSSEENAELYEEAMKQFLDGMLLEVNFEDMSKRK